MTEEQRATSAEALGGEIIDLVARHVPGDEEDIASVGVLSCIAVALGILIASGHDFAGAVAQIVAVATAAEESLA